MNNVSTNIATMLKLFRNEKGWSLDKTAEMTGVSKAMLGQIERQESSPTVATLWKIATGFNLSFSSFLEPVEQNAKRSLYNASIPKTVSSSKEQILVATIFPFDPEIQCEVLVVDLLPNSQHLSPPHQKGIIEHIIVIQGSIEILVNNIWQNLEKGDGFKFNADQNHGYRNLTSKRARFHNIIHYKLSSHNDAG